MNALPIDLGRYLTFMGVMGVMAIAPGPANVFSLAIGAQRGRRAAILAMLGMNSATLVWFALAGLGLGALVLAFPLVFKWVAYAGAAYVAWLGVTAIRGAFQAHGKIHPGTVKIGASAFRAGFAVQISNPKVVLFFTAVLPPFLDPHRPLPAQLVNYAAATLLFDGLAMTSYGLGGAALARRLEDPGFRRIFQIGVGLLLLTAAALMAFRE